MRYKIKTDITESGGSVEFYHIDKHPTLGFKEFRSKREAITAYKNQKKLAKHKLAPKVVGKICKMKIEINNFAGENYTYTDSTRWGYITQKIKLPNHKFWKNKKNLSKLQTMIDAMQKKTKLKFWDCHYDNIGIYRKRLMCIDTGDESFDKGCNAWGNNNPGPICKKCKTIMDCSCL